MLRLVSVVGRRKTCKSTFAMSAPTPIVFFDLELGADRVEDRYIPDKANIKFIYLMKKQPLKAKPQGTEEDYKHWVEFEKKYNEALEDSTVKTIVLDPFTVVWQDAQAAFLYELKQKDPTTVSIYPTTLYATPNAWMRDVILQAKLHNKNLILVHHTKEGYKKGEPTGEEVPDGFKYTGDLVEVELWMTMKDNKPIGTITICGLSPSAQGSVREQPTWKDIEGWIDKLRAMK